MNKFNSPFIKKGYHRLPYIVLLFCFPLVSIPLRGQTNEISLDVPRIVPVSPAVTAMEKYQSYPVSHCTGIPDITIPLYEIVAGDVTIPVTLSYHASGLKPKEQSGIAGTGWSLNLEPSVRRQVNGLPDDALYGWFNRFDSWNTRPTDKLKLFKYYEDKTDNKHDTQPDKFTYKLPHSSGSGYFSLRQSPLVTIPRNEDIVKYDANGDLSITDEKGLKYTFGSAYEKCDIFGSYDSYVTRWLCSSIKSARNPKQELVSFSYQVIPYLWHPNTFYNLDNKLIFSDSDYASYHRAIMIEEYGHSFRYYRIEAGINPKTTLKEISQTSAGTTFSSSCSHVSGHMSIALLTNAYFMGNRLSASYKTVGNTTEDTHSTVLDEMEVRDEHDGMIRKIKFYITSYNDRTSLTKLDSLRISAPGVEDRTYTFCYNSPSSVPSLHTTSVDHWGFYNGSREGKTVPNLRHSMFLEVNGQLSTKPYTIDYAGADREPHAEYAQIGVLNMITNPQGIQTRFTYEGNYGLFYKRDYAPDECCYLHPVGGIRVALIESYDPQTRKRINKAYKYGLRDLTNLDNEINWGGGAIKHIVTQRDYCSSMAIKVKDRSTGVIAHEDFTIYNSMPVSNITFNNGSAVMYNTVSEEVYGSTDNVLLTTMYNYEVDMHHWFGVLDWDRDDPANSVRDFIKNSLTENIKNLFRPEPYLSHELPDEFMTSYGNSNQMYGKLLYTEYYRDGKMIERVENIYKSYWNSRGNFQITIPEKRIIVDPNVMVENDISMDGIYHIHDYVLDAFCDRLLDKVIRKKYYSVGKHETVSTTEQQYEYNYNGNVAGKSIKPHKMKTIGSDKVITEDQYDYLPGYPAILSCHKHTEGNNFCESRILFKSESCLPEKIQWRTDCLGEYRDEVIYQCYDGNNNATEIVGKDGIPVSFIWSYQNRFPIARIENATIAEVYAVLNMSQSEADACAASNTIPNGIWDRINSLRGKLPDSQVTTYDYLPLHGVAIVVDPNNVTTKFSYDSYSRLTEGYFLDEDSRKVMLQKFVYHFGK